MISKELEEKIIYAKQVLKLAADMSMEYYQEPLIITYSGGKDSDVMLQLAIECLEPNMFEVMNSHTTVDAPETVYYIRDKLKELNAKGIKATVKYPRYKDGRFKSMWSLIVDTKMPPSRLARYCCRELKETSTPNRFIATGVRKAESAGRQGRNVFAVRGKNKSDAKYYNLQHAQEVYRDDKTRRHEDGVTNPNEQGVYDCVFITKAKENADLICSPIYEWNDREIWDFIHNRKMKYNPLYDKGFSRVGCIGCPLAGDKAQQQQLNKYPKYKQNYINAFDRMLKARKVAGKSNKSKKGEAWETGLDVFRWWVGDKNIKGQMDIFDFIEKEEA